MGSEIVRSLAHEPARAAVDWSKVHVWWGDERYLPSGHPERNCQQNDDAGLLTLGLVTAHVHRIPGPDRSDSVEQSASEYADTLRRDGNGRFDVMVLGVGEDGHCASLFPHHPAADTTGTTVPAGASAAARSGIAAPAVKVAAEVNAAWTGRAAVDGYAVKPDGYFDWVPLGPVLAPEPATTAR